MPWTWTHRVDLSNLISCKGVSLSYLCMTTRCLSKLQGSLMRILSTSLLLSKVNRSLCSPNLWILKPFLALQRGIKVQAITSTLIAHFVKNFAAMECSVVLCSVVRLQPEPSLLEKVSHFQDWARSSIVLFTSNCFPNPLKENPTNLGKALLFEGYYPNCLPWRDKQILHWKWS